MNNLFKEAVVVGIATSILGTILSYVFMALNEGKLNFKFDHWNTIILSEFLVGFLIHYICEYTGINKWYCDNGNACISK